jgi:hypothetical protein
MSFGIAFGEVGAIDPGRIPILASSEYDHVGSLDKEVDQVAIELIRDYLVKAYRSGSMQNNDRFQHLCSYSSLINIHTHTQREREGTNENIFAHHFDSCVA